MGGDVTDLSSTMSSQSTRYFAKSMPGFVMALNSKLFPLGSLKNIVHCSPGAPLKRIWGSMTNCRKSTFPQQLRRRFFCRFCPNVHIVPRTEYQHVPRRLPL